MNENVLFYCCMCGKGKFKRTEINKKPSSKALGKKRLTCSPPCSKRYVRLVAAIRSKIRGEIKKLENKIKRLENKK